MKHFFWYIQTHFFIKHLQLEIKQIINESNFNRYDIIIRLLAIENYYGENDFGWSLYRKLRKGQLGDVADIYKVEQDFKDLISSFEIYGYRKKSEIYVDKSFQLINGAHRTALAIYRGEKIISCIVVRKKSKSDYSIERLKCIGFTKVEIDIIEKRYRLVVQSFDIKD
ncbi:MAG: hypothetical protein MJ198_04965 [Bacteroidales bacterium]|nr:hypothetical protein [Bacteroidales bacterium]